MRIGLLGGTFDPPHLGHIALAHAAIANLHLDEVILVPAFRNPLKTGRRAPAKVRLEMVRLAIAREQRLSVSDVEIVRGGASYAVDTLHELSFVRPAEYWFILATDILRDFANWKQPERLLKMCRLGVACRSTDTKESVLSNLPAFAKNSVDWIDMPPVEISSTKIRQKIEEGRPVADSLNPDVLRFIEEKKLYRS